MASEPDSTSIAEQKRRAIWLAPAPVLYISNRRYSERDKLYVASALFVMCPSYVINSARNYGKVGVIKTIPPVNGINFR